MSSESSRRSFLAALGAVPAIAMQRTASAESPRYWTKEYWAQKGDVRLYLFRKRRNAPKSGETPLPALFLVHGSSLSGRSTFDLEAPGIGDYSMMNAFAGFGFDIWTMDEFPQSCPTLKIEERILVHVRYNGHRSAVTQLI